MSSTETEPVLIFSAGRSGSTLLHLLLSTHPELAWLPSRILDRRPRAVDLVRAAMHAVDLPLVGSRLRALLDPGEVYAFWESLAPGFADPARDLAAADVTSDARHAVLAAFGRIATRRRPRVLAKVTGWPRLAYLHEIFPGAAFVHIARDPLSTAVSFLRMPWWRGRERFDAARWGELSDSELDLHRRFGPRPLVHACLQLRIYWRAQEAARASAPEAAVLDVSYEALCAQPAETIERTLQHCRLAPAASKVLARTSIVPSSGPGREGLTVADLDAAAEILEPCYAAYRRSLVP